tara:strand:- start:48 stop:284 length:237 start_codon:yes stop_codon:yes gene_type:complete
MKKVKGFKSFGAVAVAANSEYIAISKHDAKGELKDFDVFRWPVKKLKRAAVEDELADVHSLLYDHLNELCNPAFESEN